MELEVGTERTRCINNNTIYRNICHNGRDTNIIRIHQLTYIDIYLQIIIILQNLIPDPLIRMMWYGGALEVYNTLLITMEVNYKVLKLCKGGVNVRWLTSQTRSRENPMEVHCTTDRWWACAKKPIARVFLTTLDSNVLLDDWSHGRYNIVLTRTIYEKA